MCRGAKMLQGLFQAHAQSGRLYTIREQKVITNQHGDTFLAYRLVGIKGRETNGNQMWMESWPFADPHSLYWSKGESRGCRKSTTPQTHKARLGANLGGLSLSGIGPA